MNPLAHTHNLPAQQKYINKQWALSIILGLECRSKLYFLGQLRNCLDKYSIEIAYGNQRWCLHFFSSRQRSGAVGLDVSQWRGSSLFSFDGANCSSPTAPLLMDPNTHTGHQLYPVSSSRSHAHTQILLMVFYGMIQLRSSICRLFVHRKISVRLPIKSPGDAMHTHRMIPVQNPTAFPYKTVPKYTDPWACPDHTPSLPRTPARSPTNPRSWISQHPHPCWVIWSCSWKHHRKKFLWPT